MGDSVKGLAEAQVTISWYTASLSSTTPGSLRCGFFLINTKSFGVNLSISPSGEGPA